jgi:peptide/nickel transport system permease protein
LATGRLILRRLVTAGLLLLFISAIVFLSTNVGAGDTATRIAGRDASPEQLEVIRERLNLDDPLPVRYSTWLAGVAQGDLGTSLTNGRSNVDIIAPRLKNTLILGALAFAIYVPLTLLGVLSFALARDRWPDHIGSALTLVFTALPEFVVGISLLIVFTGYFKLLPAISTIDASTSFADILTAAFLPSIVLALAMSAYAARILRGSLSEILDSDYMRMAELKGVPRLARLWRYALPNAISPALNVTALNITYLVGGVVVVEAVFSYPGLGTLLVEAVRFQDATLVAGAVLVAAAIYVIANLLADLLSLLLTPKLRVR